MKKGLLKIAGIFVICINFSAFFGCQSASVDIDRGANKEITVGQYINFGTYEQDKNFDNGKEAIEWRILDIEGNRALVISKYCLADKPYNKKYIQTTWKNSFLRKWLNNKFVKEAFSNEEQSKIIRIRVKNEDNQYYGTDAGEDTVDKIFALSKTEIDKYFSSNEERKSMPTKCCKNKWVYLEEPIMEGGCVAPAIVGYSKGEGYGFCEWWLRTPGENKTFATTVQREGDSSEIGQPVAVKQGVRPAMWVNIELLQMLD